MLIDNRGEVQLTFSVIVDYGTQALAKNADVVRHGAHQIGAVTSVYGVDDAVVLADNPRQLVVEVFRDPAFPLVDKEGNAPRQIMEIGRILNDELVVGRRRKSAMETAVYLRNCEEVFLLATRSYRSCIALRSSASEESSMLQTAAIIFSLRT